MDRLRNLIATLKELESPSVLATRTAGSDPAKPLASRWLLDRDAAAKWSPAMLSEVEAALREDSPRLISLEPGEELLLEPLQPGRLFPWIHFAAQAMEQGRSCVPAAVLEVRGPIPYAVGETFALDEHSHGLVPLDQILNAALHHAAIRARQEGTPRIERVLVPKGEVTLLLDPLIPSCCQR